MRQFDRVRHHDVVDKLSKFSPELAVTGDVVVVLVDGQADLRKKPEPVVGTIDH